MPAYPVSDDAEVDNIFAFCCYKGGGRRGAYDHDSSFKLICFRCRSAGEDATHFSMTLLEKASILTLPASEYSFPLVSHFRVGFGRKDFSTVLEVLDDYLQSTVQAL